jgi:hypothetical protein
LAASACAWRAAAFSSLSSPCLPFCPCISPLSISSPIRPPSVCTHLPLGEPELALAPSLGSDALVFLERAADDARGDGDVAVVAGRTVNYRSNRRAAAVSSKRERT